MQQLNLTTTLLNHENDYNESKFSDTSTHEHTTSSGEGSFAKVIEKQLNKEIKDREDMPNEQYDGSLDAKEDFEENSVSLLKTNRATDNDHTDKSTDKAKDKASSKASTEVNNETTLQGTHASNEQKVADSGKEFTSTGNNSVDVNTKSENLKQPEKLISYLESANKALVKSEVGDSIKNATEVPVKSVAEELVKSVNKKSANTSTEQDNLDFSGKRKEIKEQLITASGNVGERDEALKTKVKNNSNDKTVEVDASKIGSKDNYRELLKVEANNSANKAVEVDASKIGSKDNYRELLKVEVNNSANKAVEGQASKVIKASGASEVIGQITPLTNQKLEQTDTGSYSTKEIMPLKGNLLDKSEQAKFNQDGFIAKTELGVKGGNQIEEAVTRLASQQFVNSDKSIDSNGNEVKKSAGNQGVNTAPIQSIMSENHALDLKAKSLESKNLETINLKASETLSAEFAKATHKKLDSQLDTSPANTKVSESTINPSNKIELLVSNSNASRGNVDSFTTFNKTKLNEATDFAINHNLSNMSQAVNDIAAPQKNSGQIHQETISVLRQDFAQAVKDKVMVIISQKLQQFDITLDPPELGNMHVRVNLQGEQAVVNFTVNNAQTKDVLEAHMNKLKEMLSEQGVNLGDTDVNQGNDPQHNNEQSDFAHNATGNNQAHDIAEQITFSSEQFNQAITGIDYYA